MDELLIRLKTTNKVENFKTSYKESLEDNPPLEKIVAVLYSKYNRYEYAKSVYIRENDAPNKFEVKIYLDDENPSKTLLSELYDKYKMEEWEKAKYGHDKPYIRMLLSAEDVIKVVNWKYSKIN